MHVVMLGFFYDPLEPHQVLQRMAGNLKAGGIRLTVANAWDRDFASADLVIAAHPIADREDFTDLRLFGQRTINRFQRMEIARRAGAPVVPFGSPADDEELSALAASWTDGAVLKLDSSARRNGVYLWPLDEMRRPFPETFKAGQDVFMKYLTKDPLTYKVDAFAGTILGAWILPTTNMREKGWQVIKTSSIPPFDPPEKVREFVRSTSTVLIGAGVGHASFDLMRTDDGYAIIEVNTCSVGTEAWDYWPEAYASNYAEAIKKIRNVVKVVPTFGKLRTLSALVGNERDVRGEI